MITCTLARGWVWYNRVGLIVTLGGGAIMLIVAAAVHDAALVALAVIGGLWFVLGLAGIYQSRTQVHEVVLDREMVRFRSAIKTFAVPTRDIVEVSWPGRSRFGGGYLRLRTRAGQVIRVPGRLQHLVEFLGELRQANPETDANL
jgi:hypothetical protein